MDVYFCNECAHVQMMDVVNPETLFSSYVYVSGTSPVFVRHFESYAKDVVNRYKPAPDSLAVDIGSNDGTLLGFFKKSGLRTLGIDPAKEIAAQATANGIETLTAFFDIDVADQILADHGRASIVTANNVFAHADDLSGILSGIQRLVDVDGIFVFEVSYLADVLEKTLFDTIYHEHLAYHSIGPLIKFLSSHGLEMIHAERVDSHGGSIRCVAQTIGGMQPVDDSVTQLLALEVALGLNSVQTLLAFESKIDRIKSKLAETLSEIRSQNKTIAGFGAPAKATTLMYHFGIGPETIDFIVDDSPLKQGLYSPGLHIPVVPTEEIYRRKPDYLIVLAWNFAESIIHNHQSFSENGGKFIVPLPAVRVI